MYQHAKNHFIHSLYIHISTCSFFRYTILQSNSPDWPHPFLVMLTPNIFNHLLICMKLYQHAQNQLSENIFELFLLLL